MKLLSALAVGLFLSGTAARAADIPLYPPYAPQEELRGSHDWSGGYAGIHGGYGWGKTNTTGSSSLVGGAAGGGGGGLLGGLLGGDGLLGGLLGIGGGGGGGVGGIIGGVDNLLCGLLGIGLTGCSTPGAVTGILGLDEILGDLSLGELIGGIVEVDGFETVELRGSDEIEGFFGGLQVGHNWQYGSFVYGIEADLSVTDMNQSSSFAASTGGVELTLIPGLELVEAGVGTYEVAGAIETDMNFFGTLRGRMGFAWDRLLVFGTGGIAFGDVDISAAVSSTLNLVDVDVGGVDLINISQSSSAFGQASDFMVGYVVGGGVEYAFTDTISGKLEYAYMNLGETSVMLSDGSSMDVEIDMHLVKGGMNMKF